MQADDIAHAHQPHPHSDEASSALPPSSPLSTAFHRHHPQPTPTGEPADPLSSLRRRTNHPAPATSRVDEPGTIRIDVRSPWSDDGGERRRKEGWIVSREKSVGELKEELARGEYEGSWEREGMRIVWHGRILRDEEQLGEIVGNAREMQQVYTFHLVARRPSPVLSRGSSAIHLPTAPAPHVHSPSPGPTHPRTSSSFSVSPADLLPTTLALLDTTHYLLFTARHHLAHLLCIPVLEWEKTVPSPVVAQHVAREAVMSVIRTLVYDPSFEELRGWEEGFEGDSREGLEKLWKTLGGRKGVEQLLKSVWKLSVGRSWRDDAEGEMVSVELDGITYRLCLHPFRLMSPSQLLHLLMYLRITSLIPYTSALLEQSIQSGPSPSPRPTPTIPAPQQPALLDRIRAIRIPFSVVIHMFFSAIKVFAMLWMLTQHMSWDDARLWIICGAATGWWIGDGINRLQRERRQAPPAAPAPVAVAPDGIPLNVAADAPLHAAAAAAVAPNRAAGPHSRRRGNVWNILPLFHMAVDSRQLHLPLSSTHSSLDASTAQRAATDPDRAEAIRRRAGTQPPRWQTQFLLPICLWVVTLIPEWESLRARAIRRRERAMRVLVGEITSAQTRAEVDGPNEEQGEARADMQRPAHVFPQGLGVAAKKYYERVMERGEGIDWEEEREAQRALGIGEEEADEGDGMRLRML